jgi:septal ring factor EnvC (AmiA/AmiB activator)
MAMTETDALANMMAADSRRIDTLVQDVGEVKGTVSHIHDGVDKLQNALTILVRHETRMVEYSEKHASANNRLDVMDQRVKEIEKKLPALEETRGWTVKGILTVIAAVGFAVLALVIKQAP